MRRIFRTALPSLALMFAAVLFSLVIAEGILRLAGYQPWRPIRQYDAAPTMTERDAVLGWVNKAGVYRYNPSGEPGGDISVTINGDLSRGGYSLVEKPSPIWIMGCSFTFGWAVTDGAEYPAIVARELDGVHAIRNLAVAGYGTVQSFLQFEQLLAKSAEKPYAVVYGLAEFHDGRNSASWPWLRLIAATVANQAWVSLPYASLSAGGEPVFHPQRSYKKWPGAEYSALIQLAQVARDKWLDRIFNNDQGAEITVSVIRHWHQVAARHNIKFIVALLFAPTERDYYLGRLQQDGIQIVDLSDTPYPKAGTAVPIDRHPNASIHEIWGKRLADYLLHHD